MMTKFVVLLGAVCIAASTPQVKDCYAQTTVVTEVDRFNTITCRDFNGNLYHFPDEDGDWIEGDIASLLMYNNGTLEIADDKIMDARYTGWIDDWENWGYDK